MIAAAEGTAAEELSAGLLTGARCAAWSLGTRKPKNIMPPPPYLALRGPSVNRVPQCRDHGPLPYRGTEPDSTPGDHGASDSELYHAPNRPPSTSSIATPATRCASWVSTEFRLTNTPLMAFARQIGQRRWRIASTRTPAARSCWRSSPTAWCSQFRFAPPKPHHLAILRSGSIVPVHAIRCWLSVSPSSTASRSAAAAFAGCAIRCSTTGSISRSSAPTRATSGYLSRSGDNINRIRVRKPTHDHAGYQPVSTSGRRRLWLRSAQAETRHKPGWCVRNLNVLVKDTAHHAISSSWLNSGCSIRTGRGHNVAYRLKEAHV